MRVYLIRHGTTSENLEKRYVGSTDEPLTADAVAWVKKNRRRYPVPQQTVTSPMKRCVATSALLFPGIPTETKEGLRECSFGEFEYKNYQELTGAAVSGWRKPAGVCRPQLQRTFKKCDRAVKKGKRFSGVRCTWRYDYGGDGAVLLR